MFILLNEQFFYGCIINCSDSKDNLFKTTFIVIMKAAWDCNYGACLTLNACLKQQCTGGSCFTKTSLILSAVHLGDRKFYYLINKLTVEIRKNVC